MVRLELRSMFQADPKYNINRHDIALIENHFSMVNMELLSLMLLVAAHKRSYGIPSLKDFWQLLELGIVALVMSSNASPQTPGAGRVAARSLGVAQMPKATWTRVILLIR